MSSPIKPSLLVNWTVKRESMLTAPSHESMRPRPDIQLSRGRDTLVCVGVCWCVFVCRQRSRGDRQVKTEWRKIPSGLKYYHMLLAMYHCSLAWWLAGDPSQPCSTEERWSRWERGPRNKQGNREDCSERKIWESDLDLLASICHCQGQKFQRWAVISNGNKIFEVFHVRRRREKVFYSSL